MCTAQINILISDSSINFMRKEKQKKKKIFLLGLPPGCTSRTQPWVSGIWVVTFVEVLKLLNCWSVALPNVEHWVTQCWGRRQFCLWKHSWKPLSLTSFFLEHLSTGPSPFCWAHFLSLTNLSYHFREILPDVLNPILMSLALCSFDTVLTLTTAPTEA